MTFADINRISTTLSSLNIFSSASKKQQHQSPAKSKELAHKIKEEDDEVDEVSTPTVGFQWDKWDWAIVKSRLLVQDAAPAAQPARATDKPVYFKHGPGYDDFGFVSNSELAKVSQEIDASRCGMFCFLDLYSLLIQPVSYRL